MEQSPAMDLKKNTNLPTPILKDPPKKNQNLFQLFETSWQGDINRSDI